MNFARNNKCLECEEPTKETADRRGVGMPSVNAKSLLMYFSH